MLITIPFVTINVQEGVEGVNKELLEVGESFEVSRLRMLRRIVLPQIAPMLFSTVRFGFSVAIRVVTIAEIVASSSGIGYMIIQTYSRYRFSEAWGWAIIFMIVLLTLEYAVLEPIERRVFAYRDEGGV
jgi:NitT/TauT family transport system permease protein